MLIRARHYVTGDLIDVRCKDGRIASITTPNGATPDHQAGWVGPAFFDLQVNGCDGISFNSPDLTVAGVDRVVRICRAHGISGLLPTLVTNSADALLHGFTTLRQAREQNREVAQAVPGFHLEGPYISATDGPRGAHPKQHVRPPSWEEFQRFQDAAGGLIRLLTLAPEHEGAIPFIEKLAAAGVVVALGHTEASGERIREAVQAGARLSTHLGNGSHAILPRHDNYIWQQLAEDGLWASIIPDGHHLPPSVIRVILRVKTPARTVITCDSSSLAGCPPGRYNQWGQELEILPTGRVVVPGTAYLAGSWAFTDQCVEHAVSAGRASLADAVDMAGARPRELLGLERVRLEPGCPGDLVLFDWDEAKKKLKVEETLVAGG